MINRFTTMVQNELIQMDEIIARKSASGIKIADKAMAHVIEGESKRIRPAIFLLSAMACAGKSENKEQNNMPEIAAAIEMIHTASLLHDDVVDEEKTRRGRASANAAFGNDVSVLTGDFLWCTASKIIVSSKIPRLIDAVVDAVRATAVGALMELEDIGSLSEADRRRQYLQMIDGKTASLFELAARAGAIITNAEKDLESALAQYGREAGMAFQLADDAMDKSREIDCIGGASAALNLAQDYATKAKFRISTLPKCAALESLMGIADYAANRD